MIHYYSSTSIDFYCVENVVVLLSTLLAVLWSSQMYKYLNNAPNRRLPQTGTKALESDAKPIAKAATVAPVLPVSAAPTRKPLSKRKRKRARAVTKKHYKAPVGSLAENFDFQNLNIDDIEEFVPIRRYHTSIQPSTLSSSSDDETGTGQQIKVNDEGYCSKSNSSSSSSSDDESAISQPMVINGTTYYTNPIIDTLSSCSRIVVDMMSESQIHGIISNYFKASMKELKKNGYPYFKTSMSKTAIINSTQYTLGKKLWLEKEDKLRICCECQKEFELGSIGTKRQGICQYHPKGKRFDNVKQCFIRNCCEQEDELTEGCRTRPIHVFDQLYRSELDNFIQANKPTGKDDPRSKKILALDAEMVYTLAGPALARLSVIDWYGNLVLDIKVKPPTKVIDVNTEYSGLTMKDVKAAKNTLGTCRRKFLQLINSETILVGHSLESDLKALRLVHYNIADTSLIYKPGKNKIGLKILASDYLGLQIQSNNKDQLGHDSEEDARVCLDLLKLRIDNSSY